MGAARSMSLRDAFGRVGSAAVMSLPSGAQMPVAPAPTDGFWWFDDFVDDRRSAYLITGAAVANISTAPAAGGANRPGWAVQSSAAAGVDGSRICCVGGLAGAVPPLLFGGGICYFRASLVLGAVPDGVQNAITRCGWGDATSALVDHTDGVYLEVDRAAHANSNNWFLCGAINSVRSKADTGIVATIGPVELEIEVDAPGNGARCRIGGVDGGSVGNIPVAAGRATQVMLQHSKQLGAVASLATWDYYGHGQIVSPRR